MRVAVVSDTHDNQDAVEEIARILRKRNLNFVFHLGDIVSPFTLKKFAGVEYHGVFGNNDGEKQLLRKVAEELNFEIQLQPAILELFGKKFLLYHGTGSVEKTRKIIDSFAKSGEYDFVLYGHTHIPEHRRLGKTVILNPGESCGYLSGKRSFAVLDLDSGDAEFVEF